MLLNTRTNKFNETGLLSIDFPSVIPLTKKKVFPIPRKFFAKCLLFQIIDEYLFFLVLRSLWETNETIHFFELFLAVVLPYFYTLAKDCFGILNVNLYTLPL